MTDDTRGVPPRPRAVATLIVLGGAAALLFCALVALGTWQVERRVWKHALIARVEARIHAEPLPAPAASEWPAITADSHMYRRVTATGHFLHDRETLVQAVTDLGGGFWVMTPLATASGTILINRGFVPGDRRDPATRAQGQIAGETRVTGLLRITEPGGAFLRHNDTGADRWYSRDVAAIASARDLAETAPYFIDADATPNPGGLPVGGLTVVRFSDNHLVYALTWYALAVMVGGAGVLLLRHERAARRNTSRDAP